MPRKPKPSRYSQLADEGAAIPLSLADSPLARKKRARTLDTDFLDDFPNLAEPTRLGFEHWCEKPERRSQRGQNDFLSALRSGFFAFLWSLGNQYIGLNDIAEPTVNAFVIWLKRVGTDDTAVFAVNTQRRYFGVAKALFDSIGELPTLRHKINAKLRFPDYQFDLSARQQNPTPVLDDDVWEALYVAAAWSVEETRKRVEDDWNLIKENSSKVPSLDSGRAAYRERGVILAAMHKHFRGVLPTQREMADTEYVNIAHALTRLHTNGLLEGAFYPRPFDLVPSILSLEIATYYNTDVLLGLGLNSIRITEIFGTKRIVFTPRIVFDPPKNRSHTLQPRSFAVDHTDPASPSEIYDFIVRWTARIRKFARPEDQGRLFLFVPEAKNKNISSFNSDQGPSGDKSWKHNLRRWLSDFNLPHTTIRELRATGLDKVHEVSGGDIRAVQATAGHKGRDMIPRHYTSGAARRRNDESLSRVMSTHPRWVDSEGTIDPRGSPANSDLGAATPGWWCADPYSSPLPTERDKLCSALGACPDCPLGSINFDSPYSLARALQLKAEIERAKGYLAPSRWVSVWKPRIEKLNTVWLPRFDNPQVIADAELLSLTPFPELD